MKRAIAISLSCLLLVACQGGAPTRGKIAPRATATPGLKGGASPLADRSSAAPLVGDPRPVGPGAVAVALTGKVKLLSNNGAGVISNNGGGVISNNGAGVVSNNGAGLVSDAGGGLVSKTKYALAQTAPAEALLADARIEVLDATGRVLTDPDGQPIAAVSDQQGGYALAGALPDENLVLRVTLWNGGELTALLPRGAREVDLDTASTLGAAYVLAQYVKREAAVLNRLPAAEAAALHQDLEAARGQLPGVPSYRSDEMVAAAADLRAKAPAVEATLRRIEALLLVGQTHLGSGRKATEVALTAPYGVHRDAAGNVYVAEQPGRIRRVAPDGTIRLWAGLGGTPETGVAELGEIYHLVGAPDGTLWFYEPAGNRIRRLRPNGEVTTVAGGGTSDVASGAATDLALRGRMQFALAPDGAIWLADDESEERAGPSRIVRVAPDGRSEAIAFPGVEGVDFGGIVVDAEGAVTVVTTPDGTGRSDQQRRPDGALWRLAPGGAWSKIHGFGAGYSKVTLAAPRPGVVVFNDSTTTLTELGPDGPPRRRADVPGTVTGLWAGPDGALLYACNGTPVVYAVDAAGARTDVAGFAGGGASSLARGIGINSPLGLAFDAQGRLLIMEGGGRRLRRLDGDRLATVFGEAESPDLLAPGDVNSPGAIATRGEAIYALELQFRTLLRIDPGVGAKAVLGQHHFDHAEPALRDGRLLPALRMGFSRLIGLAIDPQGRPVVADASMNVVVRLNADGQAEVLAGATAGGDTSRVGDAGDGGPAADARLNAPNGLAFDSKGNLYVADSLNSRIRRITPDGRIDTYAGIPTGEAFTRLAERGPDAGPVAAKDAMLIAPFALAFDAQDNLYVAELGTTLAHKLGDAAALFETLPRVAASIRKITPDGRVSLVAGRAAAVLSCADGDDALVSPAAMVVDPDGNLIVADSGLNQVRRIPKEAL